MKESIENQTPFEKFKQDIEKRILAEETGEVVAAHLRQTEDFDRLDVTNLIEDDMEAWNMFQDGQLSFETYKEYLNSIPHENKTRQRFAEFIANRLQSLEFFRGEIEEEAEKEKTGETKTVHFRAHGNFDDLDISKLTEQDMNMWKMLQDGKLTDEIHRQYRDSIPEKGGHTRLRFAAYLGNALPVQQAKQGLDNFKLK